MRSMPMGLLICLTGALSLSVACTGSVMGTGHDNPTNNGQSQGGDHQTSSPGAGAGGAGPTSSASSSAFTSLTQAQYRNAIRDLLGQSLAQSELSPDTLGVSGFSQGADIGTAEVRGFMDMAESVAAAAETRLSTLVPCDPTADGESACATKFIVAAGRRFFRRPLTDDESSDLQALYQTARTTLGKDFSGAVVLLLRAFLQSPAFLYRWDWQAVASPSHATAARLSFFLWNTVPDATLDAEADAGHLTTVAQVEAQARRMLADGKAADAVAAFAQDWLQEGDLAGVQKDKATYPTFNGDLLAAMGTETTTFLQNVVLGGDGTFDTLLTAPYSYVNASLATLYGATAPTGTGFQKVNLDPNQRYGLLTQASFLASKANAGGSNPVKRGKEVWLQFICGNVPPPPPVVPPVAAIMANQTTRQQYQAHADNTCAQGCHNLIDPPGFAFEAYDGVGAFRSNEAGQPIDASGAVTLPSGAKLSWKDGKDFVTQLAASDDARGCFAKQLFRFANQRLEGDADANSQRAIDTTFTSTNGNIRELMVAVATNALLASSSN